MSKTLSEICVFNRRVWLQLFCFVFFVSLIALMDLSKIKRQSFNKLSKLLENVKERRGSSREDNNFVEDLPEDVAASEEPVREAKTKITILFWNSYWIWSHFGMGVGNRGFVSGGCGLQNCYTTTSRNKLRGADALVFHGEDLGNPKTIEELEILKKFRKSRREAGEKVPLYVYFMKEPPHKGNKLNDSIYLDFFDLTITYQPDSDIESAYGQLVPKDQESDSSWPKWRPFSVSSDLLNRDLSFKTKDIAWIVSHCETDSHRERYVEALRTASSLKIDVFGECGEESLPLPPRPVETEYDRQALAQVKTYTTTLSPYKFYLSFENTLCKDYITEKFFYTFASNDGPIPVALGGLKVADYARAAPPHSYLHVDDFSSPEKLAKELERLSQNKTAYNEYFWWQQFYKLNTEWDNHVKAQCKLCELLNKILNGKYDVRRYEDMTLFWNIQSRCRSPAF